MAAHVVILTREMWNAINNFPSSVAADVHIGENQSEITGTNFLLG